ncbi:hypothetical protein PG985_013648 [Apiospora marii]|uniref:Rhodopsin domain-containing protein n=1 Tax=Apiospora marii TaxID=335849 RepID=A0ABR1R7B7_9PEZI
MELTQSGKDRLIASIAACTIALASTWLRWCCKHITKSGMHLEDWIMILSLPVFIAAAASSIWGLYDGGGGRPPNELVAAAALSPTPENMAAMEHYFKATYIGLSTSPFVLSAVRVSLCLLYRRIFATASFRRKSTIVMALCIAYQIANSIVNLCMCVPLSKFWNRLQAGQCINGDLFFLLVCIVETLLDVVVLVLPARAVFFVQIPLRTKLIVAGIFLLGGFAVITNVLRMFYTYQTSGSEVDTDKAILWGSIHSATAVLCGNLPVYQPIRSKMGEVLSRMHAKLSSFVPSLRISSRQRIKNRESDAETRLETARNPATSGIRGRSDSLEDSLNLSFYHPGTQYVAAAWRDGSGDDEDDEDASSRRVVRTANSGMV